MTTPHAEPHAIQDQRDGDCLVFFVCLVTAALAMLGLSLFTGIEGMTRLALVAAITLLAGVGTAALTRPDRLES